MNKILNPFRFLPLRKALCWGIAALILTSVLFWQAGLRLTSLTQMNFAGDHLLQGTVRQLVAWVVFAVVLYLAYCALEAKSCRRRRVLGCRYSSDSKSRGSSPDNVRRR